MNFASRIDYAQLMEPVALRLLGKPNARLSKPPHDVRFGSHGAMAVNFQDGEWYDHENQIGGGVLDLIEHKTDRDRGEAQAWLRKEGLSPPALTKPSPAPHTLERVFRKVVANYDYTDERGELLFQVVRYEPKEFRQRRPDGNGGWEWSLNDVRRVLYRLPDLAPAVERGETVYIVEGEKDVHALLENFLRATCNPGGAGKWRPEYGEMLRDADVVIVSDNDDSGRRHAEQVAAALHGVSRRVRVLDLAVLWPECPSKGDISDWLHGHTAANLKVFADALPEWKPLAETSLRLVANASSVATEWPEPQPLPRGLAPVDDFDLRFLPAALQPWVGDISDRLQCPPDYVGVSAIVALGAIVGRRIGIKPQTKTDWLEVPNIWGGFIGRPGMLKSPAMQEALKPLHRLEAEAAKENEIAKEAYAAGLSAYKMRQQVKVTLEKEALKKAKSGKIEGINFELGDEPKEPAAIRFRTNDSSYEALGELLKDNASGILIERDELVSLLKHLDREEQVVARGFFLSGWSGTQPYSFDRIGRGHVNLDAVCLSVLGGTQPARISEYVRRANFGGSGGDGLIQRFGALVWPDVSASWRDVDEYPNSEAREKAWQVFDLAAKLDLQAALKLGASKGQFDKLPCLRFDDAAHEDFLGWRTDLETRLRTGALHAALEGHLAKHRKLVPALALINSVADGDEGAVTHKSLLRALAFAEYFESHAIRVYSSGMEGETAAAGAILKHIRAGDLSDGFTARDILRHGWAHLNDREQIELGLILLSDLDYVAAQEPIVRPQGGRPKVTYATNPLVRK